MTTLDGQVHLKGLSTNVSIFTETGSDPGLSEA